MLNTYILHHIHQKRLKFRRHLCCDKSLYAPIYQTTRSYNAPRGYELVHTHAHIPPLNSSLTLRQDVLAHSSTKPKDIKQIEKK